MTKNFEYKTIFGKDLYKIGKDRPGETDLTGQFKVDPLRDALDYLGYQGWQLCSIEESADVDSKVWIFKREIKD